MGPTFLDPVGGRQPKGDHCDGHLGTEGDHGRRQADEGTLQAPLYPNQGPPQLLSYLFHL